MNWELITQGLELSVMGILTTFMSLGLFIATILLLRMVFPTEPRKRKNTAVEQPAGMTDEPIADIDNDAIIGDDSIVAAISAAVYVQHMLASAQEDGTLTGMETGFVPQNYRSRRKGLGARLEQPRGRWWQPMGDNEEGK